MSLIPEIELLADLIEQKIRTRPAPIHPAAELPLPLSTTWGALVPALLKQLAVVKLRAGNLQARERYRYLDEHDPRAIAEALYLFGQCHCFAAAVAERYGLREKIRHVITGPLREGHGHVVVEVAPGQYLDYGGIHSEADLKRLYSDAARNVGAQLIQNRHLDPHLADSQEAFDLARAVLIERERDADFGIRLYGE